MKKIALFLLCAVCLLAGCEVFMPGTTARTTARPYVKPYLAALEAYHKSHNQYPETLDCKRRLKSAAGGARKVLHLPGKEDCFFRVSSSC
jgi:hypothetical protein